MTEAQDRVQKAIEDLRIAPHGCKSAAWKRLKSANKAALVEDIASNGLAGAKQERKDLE